MTHVHRLARTWRYLLVTSSIGLVLLFLLPPLLGGETSDTPSIWIMGAIIAGGISGGLTYAIVTSQIITSPEGIQSVLLGIRLKVTWDKVEKVDINPFGFVNLILKEPIYKNKVLNAILRPFATDRIFQLSPYMDDLVTSTLLQEVAKYVPGSNIPEFVDEQKQKPRLKPHQKVGKIGLYYLVWLMALVPLAFIFRKAAEELGRLGLPNLTLISYLITSSLMIGLLFNGFTLLGYNAEIAGFPETQIARKARACYLSPFVILLLSLTVSLGMWSYLQVRSIVLHDDDLGGCFALVALMIGSISLRVSNQIEKLIFQDNS